MAAKFRYFFYPADIENGENGNHMRNTSLKINDAILKENNNFL